MTMKIDDDSMTMLNVDAVGSCMCFTTATTTFVIYDYSSLRYSSSYLTSYSRHPPPNANVLMTIAFVFV